MWVYDQSSGELRHNGVVIARGYSGNGKGKNNPAMQAARAIGPVPRGRWKMVGVYDSKTVGPYTITIHAVDATPGDDRHDPTGRSAFRIHGDSIRAPGTASKGCIILPRAIRERMWMSGDHDLEVIE